ncbi:MAG: radical SAM protein [Coriobacteriales bacterium]|nr:radical SAM protein [Coriobacteriales bacterium]
MTADKTIACGLCPHGCRLAPGQAGICRARANVGGEIRCLNYGQATALALDPIEKKPLNRFHPGSRVLSYGSWGCNLSCPFCQNFSISLDFEQARRQAVALTPEQLVALALEQRSRGNIGIAFTYNEPTVSYEFLIDASALAHDAGLLTVLVTNGYLNEKPWTRLMTQMDAVNIDLKSATQTYYDGLGAPQGLETVKRSISIASALTHVEVSFLVVPDGPGGRTDAGEPLPGNDSAREMEELSAWLASVDPDIALHLLPFRPRWRLIDRAPASQATIDGLAHVARAHLKHVYC